MKKLTKTAELALKKAKRESHLAFPVRIESKG
jgi:hypothetical protein